MVGDDDSTTIRWLNDVVGDMAKHSDNGHCKRGLGSKLYELKKSRPSCQQLSATVIAYIQKMFSYVLQGNANDPAALRSTLLAIVPHAFGDHTKCNAKWCGYLQRGAASYKHAGLPHGKNLTCPATKSALDGIFSGLAEQADKLAPLGSSQVSEAFNNTVTSKAPKA